MRIGHLSDFHLLEPNYRAERRARVEYLSLWRRIDPTGRAERAARALAAAVPLDHVVVTGDLTEDGHPSQLRLFREILEASGLRRDQVTLVPGNHDAYDTHWQEILCDWLRVEPFRKDGVAVVPVITAVSQFFGRSSGKVDVATLRATISALTDEVILLVQHHPPFKVLWQAVHGLREYAEAAGLMESDRRIHVLHGHTHKSRDVQIGGVTRIFGAPAVVSTDEPLRVYEVEGGAVRVV